MFAVIFIHDFALQAQLRHEPELRDRPLALIEDGPLASKVHVLQASAVAQAAGVFPGMTPPQAQARCAGVIFRKRSPPQERIGAEILLQAAQSVSPEIEATGEGIVTANLHAVREPDWPALAAGLVEKLAPFHLRAQAGVAESPDLALLVAQSAAPWRVIGRDLTPLHALRAKVLPFSVQTLAILRKWGVRTVGEFLALPKDQLAARLGAEAVRCWELAANRRTRLLRLVRVEEVFAEAMEFEHGIETLEPLLFVLRRFLDQLALRLDAAHRVAHALHFRLGFADGGGHARTFAIPSPTRDAATLFRLLHTSLENFTAAAPIVALGLRVEAGRAVADQFELFDHALRDPNRFFETLGKLTALLGEGCVGRPVRTPGFRPDGLAVQPISPREKSVALLPAGAPRIGLALCRYRPPLAAVVEVRSRQPVHVRTVEFAGAVTDVRGFWHTSGEWWREDPWDRLEWDVQLESGALYRVFRERGEWFVEGVYD